MRLEPRLLNVHRCAAAQAFRHNSSKKEFNRTIKQAKQRQAAYIVRGKKIIIRLGYWSRVLFSPPMVNGTVPAREESLRLQQEEARWGREAEDGGAVVA